MSRKFDNPIVKPGDYVNVSYNDYDAITPYKVAAVVHGGVEILVEVEPRNAVDRGVIEGWPGYERPGVMDMYKLDMSSYYWYIQLWTLSSRAKIREKLEI